MQTRGDDGRAGLVGASGRVSVLGVSTCRWICCTPGSSGRTAALAPPTALKLLGRAARAAPPAALLRLRTSPCMTQGVSQLLAAHLSHDSNRQQGHDQPASLRLMPCSDAPAQCYVSQWLFASRSSAR